ncbi:MAG TPA: STAS domain-containing protein [Pyrinomonadaceae bacterium]|jgi:anti-anti-sigma factor
MANQINNRGQIFISYRREDSAGESGRIYDRLAHEFGKEMVFKDVDSIPLGVNFKQHIASIIEGCAVVLVVIGQRWAGGRPEDGKARLNDSRDLVRIEVESALQRGIPVIPLFINGATMPPEENLPSTLAELAYRNGMAIGHDPNFHPDVDRLIRNLKSLVAPRTEAQRPVASTLPPAPANKESKRPSVDEVSHFTAGKGLNIRERRSGQVVILDLNGALSAPDGVVVLRNANRRLLEKGDKRILYNMAGVSMTDSAGFGELVSSYTSINQAGGQLKLLRLSQDAKYLLTVTGFSTFLDVYEDEATAIKSFM